MSPVGASGRPPRQRTYYHSAYPVGSHSPWGGDIMHRRRRLAISAVAILVVLLLMSVVGLQSSGLATYVVVIDSGSTGTRVYVYKWEETGQQMPRVTALEPTLKDVLAHRKAAGFQRGAYKRIETEPGLDKAAGSMVAVQSALAPLLEWAKRTIPKQHHAAAPIFLFGTSGIQKLAICVSGTLGGGFYVSIGVSDLWDAGADDAIASGTAGLRKLPDDGRAKLLGDIRTVLRASSFRFEDDWVRVIAGSDEGLYGWVGLNYMQGRLISSLGADIPALAKMRGTEATEFELQTFGSLDLGGSSLEVTFVPSHMPEDTPDKVDVSALGTPYSLYTHSFKGYGMNDAFDKGISVLVWEQLSAATTDGGHLQRAPPAEPMALQHPCLQCGCSACRPRGTQAGFLRPYHRKDPLWRPTSSNQQDNLRANEVKDIQLEGAPDWESCKALVAKVVDAGASCGVPPCTLGVQSPPARGRFFAMAGFFVVFDFFHLPLTATLQQLEDAGRTYCQRDWAGIEEELGDIKNTETYCFRAPFVSALLQEGLGVLPEHVSIVDGGFSWTFGAALVEGVRLAGLGQGVNAKGMEHGLGAWGQISGLRLTFLVIFAVAGSLLLVAAVYQHGHFLWSPLGIQKLQEQSLSMSTSKSATLSPRWSGKAPPEVMIPLPSTGSKAVSSPPPNRPPRRFDKTVGLREQGRRRPERSTGNLSGIMDGYGTE